MALQGFSDAMQGSHQWYQKVKAEGGPSAVKGMTCNGTGGRRTPDGYFEFSLQNTCGLSCSVSYATGGSRPGNVNVC